MLTTKLTSQQHAMRQGHGLGTVNDQVATEIVHVHLGLSQSVKVLPEYAHHVATSHFTISKRDIVGQI